MSKKKKRRSKSGKGSKFERKISNLLSLWWTDGKRDDVFWRTSGSGARATARKKTGKSTVGQYGDIGALDPIGLPLIDLFTIELKRGYSNETFANIIERHQNPRVKECQFAKFIQQAEEEHLMAKSFAWLLITKRNAREPIVTMPYYLYNLDEMPNYNGTAIVDYWNGSEYDSIVSVTLKEFLEETWPSDLKTLWKKKKKTRRIQQ